MVIVGFVLTRQPAELFLEYTRFAENTYLHICLSILQWNNCRACSLHKECESVEVQFSLSVCVLCVHSKTQRIHIR